MAGNTLGQLFAVTTFGESHGPAIGCVIDGCPPNIPIDFDAIQKDLDRRKPGTSKYVTQRQEDDQAKFLSGIFEGKTTGTPIAILIENQDQRSKDYGEIAMQFRPGHADYTYYHKYGIRDHRGGGRSSARLTAPIVAAGAIAKQYLKQHFGTEFFAYTTQIGEYIIPTESLQEIENNPFFAANASDINDLASYVDQIRKAGNSCGARIQAIIKKPPQSLGEPVFDKLDADIAYVLMGLNAVKGVEIGDGFNVVAQKGSDHGDEIMPNGFVSNHAGGILGGISTGQDILVQIAIKPTSSILIEKQSVNIHNESCQVRTVGRHDPCVGIRAVPIVEALLAIVLMDHTLRHRGQIGSAPANKLDNPINT
jgi:chorismate synthase